LYITKANWNAAAAAANASTFGQGGKTSRTLVGVQYEIWW
jgi:maltoporin